MSISDCQCPYLIVSLANEALAQQSNKKGIYQLFEEINGKPSWKSGTQAIWYYPDFNQWMIGPLSSIGTSNRGITSTGNMHDCPLQVPKDKWKYYIKDGDGERWQYANSNDIIIECEGKNVKMYLVYCVKLYPGWNVDFLGPLCM